MLTCTKAGLSFLVAFPDGTLIPSNGWLMLNAPWITRIPYHGNAVTTTWVEFKKNPEYRRTRKYFIKETRWVSNVAGRGQGSLLLQCSTLYLIPLQPINLILVTFEVVSMKPFQAHLNRVCPFCHILITFCKKWWRKRRGNLAERLPPLRFLVLLQLCYPSRRSRVCAQARQP